MQSILAAHSDEELDVSDPALDPPLLPALPFPPRGAAEKGPNVEAIADWKKSMAEQLTIIDGWLNQDYLAGDKLSGADFTLYPYAAFLGRIDARKPGNNLLALVPPKLAAWMKRIEALPYFMKTYPPHWKG